MSAVYKRELKAVFHSVIGYVFIAALLFFIGLYFSIYNLGQGYPYVAIVLSSIVFVVLLALPILTMRVMTEDRKQNTDKLLYTAPVKTISVILGKYFAMVTVFLIPILFSGILPLFLGLYGKVPYRETYIAILGFFVYGAACIAIGMFVSSITENQIVAAALSFVFLFIGYMMSGITQAFSAEGNLITKVLRWYSFRERITTFFDGVADLPSFLYFITLSALFLFFTYEVLQKKRFSYATKRLQRGAFSVLLIAAVIAAAVLLNYGVSLLPDRYKQFDVTDEGLYGITDSTEEFLQNLDEEITIYTLSSQTGTDSIVDRLLKNYVNQSDHITVEYKEPSLYPAFISQYSDQTIESGSLIVESDKRFKVIPNSDLYETELDYTTYQQKTTGFDGEGQITGAIAYVISDDMPKLYQICGHEELSIGGALQKAIEKQNVQIETLNLMEVQEIPEDAAGIAVLAPTRDFSAEDAAKVKTYLDHGGKAVFVTSWMETGLPNLTGVFADYGLHFENGIVADPAASRYYDNQFVLLPEVSTTVLSADIFNQQRYVLMPYAQGLRVTEQEGADAAIVYQILTTSEESYVKNSVDHWEKEAGDPEGPFAVAVYVTKQTEEEQETEFFLATTENLLSEQADALVSGSNFELVTNMIARMKGEESGLSIPVKRYMAESFTVPRAVFFFGFAVLAVLLPTLLLLTGIFVRLSRRKR